MRPGNRNNLVSKMLLHVWLLLLLISYGPFVELCNIEWGIEKERQRDIQENTGMSCHL